MARPKKYLWHPEKKKLPDPQTERESLEAYEKGDYKTSAEYLAELGENMKCENEKLPPE